MTENIAKKFFTMAKFYMAPERSQCLGVLKSWLEKGDGSRFCRGHLDFPEIKELQDSDQAAVLRKYSEAPHT